VSQRTPPPAGEGEEKEGAGKEVEGDAVAAISGLEREIQLT
jgi:hypothetical protein